MSLVHTRSLAGSSGLAPKYATVPPTTMAVVDTEDSTLIYSIKWMVTVTDLVSNKSHFSEIAAVVSSGNISHTRYAKIGDKILYNIDVMLSGTDINLEITNSEVSGLEVVLLKAVSYK